MGFGARDFRVHILSLPLIYISYYFMICKMGFCRAYIMLIVGIIQDTIFKDFGHKGC